MKVKLADKTGFCFGVSRAIRMAEKALSRGRPIYSLGSIIHNRQVVDRLSRKGLKVVRRPSEVRAGGRIVISSHGISPKTAKALAGCGIKIIDTTCPFVLKAQRIAARLGRAGYKVVIVGDKAHPEVKALVGFVPKKKVVVVGTANEAGRLKFKKREKISVISQTTQDTRKFAEVVKVVLAKLPGKISVFDTICRDAQGRQAEAKRLAAAVDVMLIVGGANSANTKRLFEVSKRVKSSSHLIETEGDLKRSWLKGAGTVGITSGASTPDWLVKKVVSKLKAQSSKLKAQRE